MDLEGRPFRCWKLQNVSLVSEDGSDGIYWETDDHTLVHLSGQYNYVQKGSSWDSAFGSLGLTERSCLAIGSQVYDVNERGYRSREPAPRKNRRNVFGGLTTP